MSTAVAEQRPEAPDLVSRGSAGAVAMMGQVIAAAGLGLVVNTVAARLLGPTLMGEFALAVALAELAVIAFAGGINFAVVQRPDGQEAPAELYDAAFVIALSIAVMIGLIASGGAVLANAQYGGSVAMFFAIICLTRALEHPGHVYLAALEREVRFTHVAVVNLVASVCSQLATLFLLLLGVQLWSLAAREIAAIVIRTVAYRAFSRWRFGWRWSPALTRSLVSFSARMSVSQALEVAFHRLDNLLVGTLGGASQLGIYAQSYSYGFAAQRALSPANAQVSFAMYARLHDDPERRRSVYGTFLFWTASLTGLFAVSLFALSGLLVQRVLGDEWLTATPVLQVFAIYALLVPLMENAKSVLYADGHIEWVMGARALQTLGLICLGFGLIPTFGALGGAITATISLGLGILFVGWALRSKMQLGGGMVTPLASAFAGMLAVWATPVDGPAGALVGLGWGLLVFVLVTCLLDRRELRGRLVVLFRIIRRRGLS